VPSTDETHWDSTGWENSIHPVILMFGGKSAPTFSTYSQNIPLDNSKATSQLDFDTT